MEPKKKLILITYDQRNSLHYETELLDFFGDILDIELQTVFDGIGYDLDADAVLTLSPISTSHLAPHLREDVEIVHGSKVITKTAFKQLKDLPPGTKALLITTNKTTSFEMATYLYQIGMNHIDFYPYSPGSAEEYELDTAITPGQTHFIPNYIKNVVDLGWRKISLDTYMSLMVILKLKSEALIEKLYHLSKDVLSHDFLSTPLDNTSRLKDMMSMIIDKMEDGILFLSTSYRPVFENTAFHHMLNLDPGLMQSPALIKYLPAELSQLILDTGPIDNHIVYIRSLGQSFTLSKHTFYYYKNSSGFLITLKDVRKIEKLEQEIRRDSVKKHYSTKYTFSDILGSSKAIRDCIYRAQRMAATDYPVLITGETGTGKEVFAQSIHNASQRGGKPFVAINCASLSGELLESELFGYDDASFTGARKGGKKGLFEFAHTGTIFLDEIGDMPFPLQARLLRVLQEKEIRKVGSTVTIPIDVRIIAATNKNLEQMMNENLFRTDLFFRISMFSLHLPPLRERPEDIRIMAESFLREMPGDHVMDKALLKVLSSRIWKGNIRELKNCIEYMAYMGGETLLPGDLPPGYGSFPDVRAGEASGVMQEITHYDRKLCFSILKLLYERPMGRTRLLKSLGSGFTEYEVRLMLEYLTGEGYLAARKGRGGTYLTSKGIEFAKQHLV